jgi:hypothetical protein
LIRVKSSGENSALADLKAGAEGRPGRSHGRHRPVHRHAGAVVFVRAGYPDATTMVLGRIGSVPEELEI